MARLTPRSVARIATSRISQTKSDPIRAFRFSSKTQRRFAECLSLYREIALRSGNQAGKTTIGAFCGVALARGVPELDGVKLPILGAPNFGVVLAKGRAMAKGSVIKAYREAIGDHPHHIEKVGNTIEAIWVKPDRSVSDDWETWSCIRFFVEGGQSVAGMRLDWVHGDEPPDWDLWMELRMRGRANRMFIRFITFTPIDKREWKPLREDFKGCQNGKDGKIELVMTVYDNKALGPEHLRNIERDAKGPLAKAKLEGEYVDLTATNPFDGPGLVRWLNRAKDPTLIDANVGRMVQWQHFHDLAIGDSAFVIADPSAGIWDERGEHDPAGIWVVSRRKDQKTRPKLLARYNGYLPAFELGRLGRILAVRYGNALLAWERNGGYGEAFFLGTKDEHGREYGNVYMEYHEDSKNMTLSERVGWTTTATTRGTIVSALQKAIVEDGLLVESREAVESLQEVIMDRQNRIVAGAGSHDEDMICGGLACHLLETIPLRTPPPGPLDIAYEKGVFQRPRPRIDDSMDGADW